MFFWCARWMSFPAWKAGWTPPACAGLPAWCCSNTWNAEAGDARVIIMGERLRAFWRVAPEGEFRGNLSQGGRVDAESRPYDLEKAMGLARRLRDEAGIDLAAVDFLIPEGAEPLLLEINFYFGRQALGGAQAFLEEFLLAVRRWLQRVGLDGGRVSLGV